MPTTFKKLLHPITKELHPYIPGKSVIEIQQQYHLIDVIKMCSNENAWGCSSHVLQVVKSLHFHEVSVYPSTYHHPFFHILCENLNIPCPMVCIGNGSDAIFSLLIQAFALPEQKHILTHQYAFMGFEIQAASFGLQTEKVNVDPVTWKVSAKDIIKKTNKNTAIIFLANPNNPTGQMLNWLEIKEILDKIPKKCIFVLDQAYYEYLGSQNDPKPQELLQQHPNLVITRTFSKAFGLAGLRLGYALAHPDVISILKKVQLPFAVNQIAMNAGIAAIRDKQFVAETVNLTLVGKNTLSWELSDLGFKVRPSYGNFVTLEHTDDVAPMVQFLESKGIIIRALHQFGLPNAARITVGLPIHNKRCVEAIQEYLSKKD
jgi:histidinol-phosphate aminotransferase